MHAQPPHAAAQEAYKAQEGASVAFLNWRFGLTQTTLWRIEVAPFPNRRTWLPPQKLSSPSQSLYMDMGMVMMPKKGVPRDAAMGRSMGSTSATKSDAGVKLVVPTSSRTSPAARRVCHPARLWESCILGAPPLEAAMPLRDTSLLISAASG